MRSDRGKEPARGGLRAAAAAALVTALVLSGAASAAHYNGGSIASGRARSAVVNRVIRSIENTQWDHARFFGVAQWDAYRKVDFTPGTSQNATLTFIDGNDCRGVAVDASYAPKPVLNIIMFNSCHMRAYALYDRQAIGTHEVGHSLGLGDHHEAVYKNTAIMYYAVRHGPLARPQAHDRADYAALWP